MPRFSVPSGFVLAMFLLLFVGASHAWGYYLLASFQKLFTTGGIPIPPLTRVILVTHKYWLLFPVLGLAGCVMLFWSKDRRGWYLLTMALLSVLILLPLTVWAMYAPVTQN